MSNGKGLRGRGREGGDQRSRREGKGQLVILQHAVEKGCLNVGRAECMALGSFQGQHAHRALTVT